MIAESVNFSFLSMQAVALPEAKEVTEDPGKLPEPDKVTKAYFEVSLLLPPPPLPITAPHCQQHSFTTIRAT